MSDKVQHVIMTTQGPSDAVSPSIDLTPIWGETGSIIRRLIRADELSAFEHMEVEVVRVFSTCQALQAIQKDLPDDLREIVRVIIAAKVTRQGFGPNGAKGREATQ